MHALAFAILAVSIAAVVYAGIAARWSYFGSNRTFAPNLLRVTLAGLAGIVAALILLAVTGR
jgi:hypothetical protein